MSDLLDAVRGVPNACEPQPGLATGGQPTEAALAALKAAGCHVVLDIRDPMEPRAFREPEAVRAAGLEYVNIPVGPGAPSDATFMRVRETVKELIEHGKRTFFHCGSGDRVGATLIPYLMLDKKMEQDDAVTVAMRVGTRSAELVESALSYVARHAAP